MMWFLENAKKRKKISWGIDKSCIFAARLKRIIKKN